MKDKTHVIINIELSVLLQNFLIFYYSRSKHNFFFPKNEGLNFWLSNSLRPGEPTYEIESNFEIEVPLMFNQNSEFYHINKVDNTLFISVIKKLYKNWTRTQFETAKTKCVKKDHAIIQILNDLNLFPTELIKEINSIDFNNNDALKLIKTFIIDNAQCKRYYEAIAKDYSRYYKTKKNRRYYQKNQAIS